MVDQIVLTLPTAQREATRRFYEDVLGFVHVAHHKRPGDFTLDLLRHESGAAIEIVAGTPIMVGEIGAGAPFLSLFVADLQAVRTRLSERAISIERTIEMPDGVQMLRIRDPNGALISFVGGFVSGL
jgi:catechol 2,3-dioxygenase-like lactoylglutathione lyase family enzyme